MPLIGPPTIEPGLVGVRDDDLEVDSLNLSTPDMFDILTMVTVETRAPAALPVVSSGSLTSNAIDSLLGEFLLVVLRVFAREFLLVGAREFLAVGPGELLLVGAREFLAVGPGELLLVDAREFLLVGPGEFLLVGAGVPLLVGAGVFLLVGPGEFLLVGAGVFLLVGPGELLLVGAREFLVVDTRDHRLRLFSGCSSSAAFCFALSSWIARSTEGIASVRGQACSNFVTKCSLSPASFSFSGKPEVEDFEKDGGQVVRRARRDWR